MRLLVIGATGPLGQEVVRQALAQKTFEVAVLVRNPATAHFPPEVKVFQGDILDPASLAAAIKGSDVLISAVGTALTRKPVTMLSQGTKNIVSVMKELNVKRFICVTGIGAGDSKGHGGFLYDKVIEPLLLHQIYQDKTRQEAVLQASDIEWTIVRPAMLNNGPRTQKYRVVNDLTGFTASKISRADVADFLLAQACDKSQIKKAPVITN